MNLLFVCNQGKYRSRTAAELFGGRFAGVFNGLKEEDLQWADVVYVFEEHQRTEIGKQFPAQYLNKRILNLDIPDNYGYMNAKLVDVLRRKLG